MSYVIFEVKSTEAGKIQTMLQDDIVNRQSIVIRDANSLEIKEAVSYLKVEGSAEGLKRAEELAKELGMKKLPDKKAKKIDKKIKEQEDSAATGMGMIFD
jgi:Mg/Co/Ni transporter MgtE